MAGLIRSHLRWRSMFERISWNARCMTRRVLRRNGMAGIGIAALGAIVLAWTTMFAVRSLRPLPEVPPSPEVLLPVSSQDDLERGRLGAFDALLSPPKGDTAVLHDLLASAQTNNLTVSKGEYARESDFDGQFDRVRMVFPLRGDAEAIHAYLLSALHAHPSLALERLHLQRDRTDVRELEARVHWLLFAQQASRGNDDAPRHAE